MSAGKQKFYEDDLAGLFEGASRLLVGKGKTHVEFDPKTADAAEIAAKVLGRSGTLRAPAARFGDAWVVGFTQDMWSDVL